MKFEEHDITNSKSHLIALIKNENLNLEEHKVELFINFISDEITSDFSKASLFKILQSFSLYELTDLIEKFRKEDDFDNLISKSFQIKKRRQLKNNLIQLELEQKEINLDELIEKAFQIEKRDQLKQKLNLLENQPIYEKSKVISIKQYLKAISIAASTLLILFVWQPQHSSDTNLFNDYANSIDNTSINDFANAERIKEQGALRGEDELFRNYTYFESLELLEAIELVKENNFAKAKEVFNSLHIEKEKNPGLALCFSIVQLRTDNLDAAIETLEYLKKLHDFPYQDEIKFHLAFAYLKLGERKKSKELLRELARGKNKFSGQAQKTLKKIRWF